MNTNTTSIEVMKLVVLHDGCYVRDFGKIASKSVLVQYLANSIHRDGKFELAIARMTGELVSYRLPLPNVLRRTRVQF